MVGLLLVRALVPLWVLTGASAKLIAASPRLLPEHLRRLLEGMGIDLHTALAVFLTIEFAAVAVMVLKPALARVTAIFMLASFCLVLTWEMINGNFTDCGCLATFSPPPWVMLAIDAALLVSVCVCPIRQVKARDERISWAAVSLLAVVMGWVSFTAVPERTINVPAGNGHASTNPGDTTDTTNTDGATTTDADPVAPAPVTPTVTLPAYYQPDVTDWAGQSVDDIDLLTWTPGLPDMSSGRHYVIYYSRVCEHCNELLIAHFEYDLPANTVLVAIPESTEGFETEGTYDNPCGDCVELELPVGVDWLMSPPVVIAVEDGVVQCAVEAEDAWEPSCLPWHGF